jgi:hypothetical protein
VNICWRFAKPLPGKAREENSMRFFTKSLFSVEFGARNALFSAYSGVGTLPCISNDGSSFRLYDYPRITDVIFTGPYFAPYRTCGLTSLKSRYDMVRVRRRVDYLSTQDSSKGFSATPLPLLARFNAFYSSLALSVLPFFLALRPRSVRYV